MVLLSDDREYYNELLKEADYALPELKQAKTTPPDMTFRQQLTFYLGKRQLDVMFLGRGNTAGDAVIYVPDRKVLITGDLVVNPTPYALGSFMTEWIQTMKTLQAMDAAVIIPGHGPVEHDGQYMQLVTSVLESSLEALTVVRYDDVNMNSDVSNISMSINNGLLTQLLSIQQLPTQSRFKSHS
jgi:glyoxylase-like metal-dependent hydrolase (beta-lactamase superfamily II)